MSAQLISVCIDRRTVAVVDRQGQGQGHQVPFPEIPRDFAVSVEARSEYQKRLKEYHIAAVVAVRKRHGILSS